MTTSASVLVETMSVDINIPSPPLTPHLSNFTVDDDVEVGGDDDRIRETQSPASARG